MTSSCSAWWQLASAITSSSLCATPTALSCGPPLSCCAMPCSQAFRLMANTRCVVEGYIRFLQPSALAFSLLGGTQDVVKPCICALTALLHTSEQCFQTFRQLHKDTAGNIAAAIKAACETLHNAGAFDVNQKRLRADVRTAFSLVEVRVVTLTRRLMTQYSSGGSSGDPCCREAHVSDDMRRYCDAGLTIHNACSHVGAATEGYPGHPAHHGSRRHPLRYANGFGFSAACRLPYP